MIARLATVIAHRGASADACENSLAALHLAAVQGATCVEIDVQISRDGVPFLHHDERLGRIVEGDERLCELDARELSRRRLRDASGAPSDATLPTLADALDVVLGCKLVLNLEIKPAHGLEARTVEAICSLLACCWPSAARIVLSSFDEGVLDAAKYWLPELPRALITDAVPDDWPARLAALDCRNLHIAEHSFDPRHAADVQSAGHGLYCYTVNEIPRARALLQAGVDGIFTDVPARMLPLVQSFGRQTGRFVGRDRLQNLDP